MPPTHPITPHRQMSPERTPAGVQVPDIDWESALGADWGQWNPKLATRYSGEWLVVRHEDVVAHGKDIDEVRAEAAAKTGIAANKLVVFAVAHPNTWL